MFATQLHPKPLLAISVGGSTWSHVATRAFPCWQELQWVKRAVLNRARLPLFAGSTGVRYGPQVCLQISGALALVSWPA